MDGPHSVLLQALQDLPAGRGRRRLAAALPERPDQAAAVAGRPAGAAGAAAGQPQPGMDGQEEQEAGQDRLENQRAMGEHDLRVGGAHWAHQHRDYRVGPARGRRVHRPGMARAGPGGAAGSVEPSPIAEESHGVHRK